MLHARPIWTLTLPDYAPDVRFSPDGRFLGAATVASPVVVVDPWSGDARFRTEGHPGGALSLAWCVTHPLLATGGADGTVALHRAGEGAPRARVVVGRGWVDRLEWSPDGEVLAAAVGRAVRFLSPSGALRGGFDGHPSTVMGLAWHAGRGAWLTAAYGVISLLHHDEPEPRAQHYFRTSMLTVHPSPDGRFVASGTQDPLVHVWDLEDETNEVNLTGYTAKVAVLAWSPARALLATGAGPSVVVWDFTGGDPFRHRPQEVAFDGVGRVTSLAFLRNGALLAGTDAGGVSWVDLGVDGGAGGRAILARVPGAVCSLVPSPDGRAVLVVSAGGGVAMLSLTDGA